VDTGTDIELFKAQVQAELNRLEAKASAKTVAGKAIGKDGLKYITAIAKLDRLDRKEMPMRVDVEGDHVTVTKGDDVVRASK